jgi:hypothetical protein
MFTTQALVDWINALPKSLPVPFTAGPEMAEFGKGDGAGTVTRVPGGQGERREGTFEQIQLLFVLRSRREKYDLLEKTTQEIDDALRVRGNEELWGTYVLYALRQGTIDPGFEEPERVSFSFNYMIEIGRENG